MTEVLFREDNEDNLVPFKVLRMGDVFKSVDKDAVFLKIPFVSAANGDYDGNAVLLKEKDNDITGTITYFCEDQMVIVYDRIEITGYK